MQGLTAFPVAATMLAALATITAGCAESAHTDLQASDVNMVPRDRTPHINIVFVDDASAGLPASDAVRRNDWPTWEKRLPTFLGLLRLAGDFRRAPSAGDAPPSIHALEISAALSADKREETLAAELAQLQKDTGRPSAILARSSAGKGQPRLVFQDMLGYATGALPWSEAQRRAVFYKTAAFEGVALLRKDLQLQVSALASSNAGMTDCAGILALGAKNLCPVNRIYSDDAQVHKDQVEKVITCLGAKNVGFFCDKGGFHGSLEHWGIPAKPIPGLPAPSYSRGDLSSPLKNAWFR